MRLILVLTLTMMVAVIAPLQFTQAQAQISQFGDDNILRKLQPEAQCVILIHGITADSTSLADLEKALTIAGYKIANIDWTTGGRLEPIADRVFTQGLAQCRAIAGVRRIHLVGHSTGGIIIRQYLANAFIAELGYVVMLGVPNSGSYLMHLAPLTMGDDYRRTYGRTGEYLRIGADEYIASLPDASDYHVGMIAGTGHDSFKDRLYALFLRGVDDGRVSVSSAMINGMNDFLIFPYQHNSMLQKNDVHRQVINFLDEGKFNSQ